MNAMMKNLILGLPFARALWTRLKAAPGPAPHSVKQRAVAELARAHGAKIFVETGTYRGDMVAAMQPNFDKLYSIELSPELHRAAVRRFEGQPAARRPRSGACHPDRRRPSVWPRPGLSNGRRDRRFRDGPASQRTDRRSRRQHTHSADARLNRTTLS